MKTDRPDTPNQIQTQSRQNKWIVAGVALLALVAGVVGLNATAYARMPDGNGNYYLAADQSVDHTMFAAGRQVTIDGNIDGDLFCAGGNVTVSGHISGDVICAAQDLRVTGQVDGDVRAAGQTVVIESKIDGSLSAAGAVVTVDSRSSTGRDASLAGSTVTLNGAVDRDVHAAGNSLSVGSKIGRNVELAGERLTLTRSADISGNVTYESRNNITRDSGAKVGGQVTGHQPAVNQQRRNQASQNFWTALTILVTVVILATVLPRLFWRASDIANRSWGKTLGIGFLASIAAPVIIILLMVTLVGIPLGIMALLLWILMLLLTGAFASFSLGRALLRSNSSAPIVMLVGAVVIGIAYIIPVLNILTFLAVIWFGLGSMVRYAWSWRQTPVVSTPTASAEVIDVSETPKASRTSKVSKTKKKESKSYESSLEWQGAR